MKNLEKCLKCKKTSQIVALYAEVGDGENGPEVAEVGIEPCKFCGNEDFGYENQNTPIEEGWCLEHFIDS